MILSKKVILVKPIGFRFNEETAIDNAFQQSDSGDDFMHEYRNLKSSLEQNGIEVEEYCPPDTSTPDAVFPNNWFSVFPDKRLFLYPMMAVNRRKERRVDLIEKFKKEYALNDELIHFEEKGIYLEGTGSLIIDHSEKIAFASLSKRTNHEAVEKWKSLSGYEVITFDAFDQSGSSVYHTNVVMTLGEGYCIVCIDAIPESEREKVKAAIERTGRELIFISLEQMNNFCGNCLQLISRDNKPKLFMSETAYTHFEKEQLEKIRQFTEIVAVAIPTIEKVGGGSVRCMIAEVY